MSFSTTDEADLLSVSDLSVSDLSVSDLSVSDCKRFFSWVRSTVSAWQ
ncbi:hypothetical protein [Salinibacter ruber]|nr:hypothetical protein [Salinibacter ruber]MCS4152299.1 uncharacterized protein YegL [Salinibacter ruber]